MKYRTKLILIFSCIVFLSSLVVGFAYYEYNSRQFTDMVRQNLMYYSEQLAGDMDETIDSMKQVTDYILSDADMLSAIQSIPNYHKNENELELANQISVLTSGISSDYIIRNFYRVLIFNEYGDVVSSKNRGDSITRKNRNILEIDWLEEAAEAHGKPILLAPVSDEWGVGNTPEVFSLARKVQGGDFGYIEVQCTTDLLKERLELPDETVAVAVWLSDGERMYVTDDFNQDALIAAIEEIDGETTEHTVLNKENWFFSISVSDTYDIRVATIQNKSEVLAEQRRVILLSAMITALCFGLAMIVVILIVNALSKPIIRLREEMEKTGIENLDADVPINATDDEMKALELSYHNLLTRLNKSMIKEKSMSVLQLQAQFDTLQAQINPHFIYNVLNVISNRGIMSGDDEICEICGHLAAMLRYSTSTKERHATMSDELEYLKKYITLLKFRYEHRLEVEMECEESIMDNRLPKMTLQPLVENCVTHGYKDGSATLHINVRGWKDENGWFVEVSDDGQGISEERRQELLDKMDSIKSRILNGNSNIEMEIGGMGLAHAYARLFLMYGERVIFKIKDQEKGFCVVIGVSEER
jgi:two-component system sensor histidine kinase YesM